MMMLSTSVLSSLVAEDAECKVGASNGHEDQENRENLVTIRQSGQFISEFKIQVELTMALYEMGSMKLLKISAKA